MGEGRCCMRGGERKANKKRGKSARAFGIVRSTQPAHPHTHTTNQERGKKKLKKPNKGRQGDRLIPQTVKNKPNGPMGTHGCIMKFLIEKTLQNTATVSPTSLRSRASISAPNAPIALRLLRVAKFFGTSSSLFEGGPSGWRTGMLNTFMLSCD